MEGEDRLTMRYGYARVSTADQDTALQRDALRRAGVRRVFAETASGARSDRPQLQLLVSVLQAGDEVLVYKIDRLARSLFDLLGILRQIDAAGARFRSITEPFDTSTPVGRMVVQLLGVIAEFERALILERTGAGMRAAQARGVRLGRPRRIDHGVVHALAAEGLTPYRIARRLGEHRRTIEGILKRGAASA